MGIRQLFDNWPNKLDMLRYSIGLISFHHYLIWLLRVNLIFESLTVGTIGQKAGFTETLDTQVKKILNTTAGALKKVALSKKPKPEKGHPQIRDEEFLEQNPQHRPVVVIDNFLHKADNAQMMYENIAKWAAALTESNIAHVIFLTNDVGYSKVLATDRVLRTVTLSDKDPETAKIYVLRQLEYIEGERRKQRTEEQEEGKASGVPEAKERQLNLDNCIRVLGGRMKDLEGLAQRLAMGASPDGLLLSFLINIRCAERHHRTIRLGNPETVFPWRCFGDQVDAISSLDSRQATRCESSSQLQRRAPRSHVRPR